MTLKEKRLQMGIVGTELAYCEAIDREIAKSYVSNYWSPTSTCAGRFYPTRRYYWLSKQLSRYRSITKEVKCLTP